MELLIILIIVMFFLLSSIRIPVESERIVIFRVGRFFKVVGPGLVLIIPVIDKAIRIKLSDKIPGWQELSKEQLDLEIKKLPEIDLSNEHLH